MLLGVTTLTLPTVYSSTILDAITPFVKAYSLAWLRLSRVRTENQQMSAQALIMANSLLPEIAYPWPSNTRLVADF